jgi:hypothetical protein
VCDSFKAAASEVPEQDWRPITRDCFGHREKTKQQYAEVCFVPKGMGFSKKDTPYRYLAIREKLEEQALPGLEAEQQQKLPFPTIDLGERRYKLFGIVTNIRRPDEAKDGWDGQRVIEWHRGRCGKSEEAHSVMKGDFAGGTLPSRDFGKNAAWWGIMILAMNLNAAMKRLVLGKQWEPKRMKAVRFSLIHIAGRILEHAKQLIVRIANGHPSLRLLLQARERIAALALAPR